MIQAQTLFKVRTQAPLRWCSTGFDPFHPSTPWLESQPWQLEWHTSARAAGERWTGLRLNGAGARALVACAEAHAELMQRHPREAERRWARDASALYQLRYRARKRERVGGDGAQVG